MLRNQQTPQEDSFIEVSENPYAEKLRSIHRDIQRKLISDGGEKARKRWERYAKNAGLGRLRLSHSHDQNLSNTDRTKDPSPSRSHVFRRMPNHQTNLKPSRSVLSFVEKTSEKSEPIKRLSLPHIKNIRNTDPDTTIIYNQKLAKGRKSNFSQY